MGLVQHVHDPSVVVGVDGSERNVAAVDWAVAEARACGLPLLLVGVAAAGTMSTAWAGEGALQYSESETKAYLERVLDRVPDRERLEAVDPVVRVGEPGRELLEGVSPADVVVVGRRGIGLVEQLVLGSTSLDVAGRSPAPVVVVPSGWRPGLQGPVVAGVDGTDRDEGVLAFAFARADRERVPLVVVCSLQFPAVYAWEVAEVESLAKDAEDRLLTRLEPWQARFPSVDLACRAPVQSPAVALLEAAPDTEVLVVGRYAGTHHLGGFSGLSTVRRVLHHATCPVAVVPSASADPEMFRFDDTDVPQF